MQPRPERVAGLPLLGNTLQFLRDTSGLLNQAYKRYGPVYRLRALWLRYTVIGGFEAKEFLQEGLAEKHLSRHKIFDAVGEQLGSAEFVLALTGERHERLRRLLALAYSRTVASPFVPKFIEATRQRIHDWQAGASYGVTREIELIAFDQYCRAMCGRSLMEHHKDCLLVTDYNMNIGGRVWPFFLFKAPWYQSARRRVLDLMWGIVRQSRESPTEGPETIVDTLMRVADKRGELMSDDEVVCYSMYGFAGSSSYMGRVVAFMLYEIMRRPELYRRLTGEVDEAFERGLENASDVRRMTLLRAVYNETLRRRPVSQGMPFHTDSDFEFHGKKVCAGDTTVLSQVPMSFAEHCFPNPEQFEPERMLPPRNEHRAGAFHPFGIAHRTCSAMGLVELMAMTMVATLLRELDLEVRPENYRLRMTVKPLPAPDSSLRMRVKKRRTPADWSSQPAYAPEEHITADFEQSDNPAVRHALEGAARREFAAEDVILEQGAPAENFYLITSGSARVIREDSGTETELARLGPGEYFGEIGLLLGVPRTATVVAHSPLEVLELGREAFLEVVAESDLLAREIAGIMRKREAINRMAQTIPTLSKEALSTAFPEFQHELRPAGEVVLRMGDESDRFYVLVEGEAIVTQQRPGQPTEELARLSPGRYFGEIGLLNRSPRTATVLVSEDAPATLMWCDRDRFDAMVSAPADGEADLAGALLERLRRI